MGVDQRLSAGTGGMCIEGGLDSLVGEPCPLSAFGKGASHVRGVPIQANAQPSQLQRKGGRGGGGGSAQPCMCLCS